MSEKYKKRVGPFKWLLGGVALLVLLAVIFWPRSVIVSGQVGEQFQGKTVDLRLSVYDTESSSDPVQIVDYDGVRTTSDGRFDLIYNTSLFGLPTQSYMQLCIKTNMDLADWNEAIPPCHEETTAASPTTSVNVKGVNTISGSAVSCTRREITSGVPGVLNRLFGNQKNRYEFYNFCDDTYTSEEFSNIVIEQEITQQITNQVQPQKLSLKDEELTISQGNTIKLPESKDEQELVLDGDTLSISGGNEVVIDATADPFSVLTGTGLSGGGELNEGQTLSLENTGVLTVGSAGPITSTGGQNPVIDLTLCSNGEVLQVTGGVWTCNTTAGTYSFSITDSVITEGIAGGDTITFVAGNGLQTSISATDTVTYSVPNQGIDTLQLANDAVTSTQILNGSVSNADLTNDSITVTAGTGLSGGGVTALGGAVVLNSTLGTAIDTSEITDGTLVFADFAQNGCSGGQPIEWGGAAWVCGTDDVNDADSNASNELQNLFETIDAPGGTDPVADSLTDTLAFANGSGVTITGDASTDTLTIAAVLGTSIDSSEITDGTVSFADISTNGCSVGEIFEYSGAAWICGTDDDTDTTYSAGTGISFAGTVISSTLGTSIDSSEIDNGTITSDDIAANTLDAGDIATGAVESTEILNGTILFEDLASNSCSSGQVIEYDGSDWVCGTDDSGGSFSVDVTDGSTTETLNNTDTLTFVDGAGVDVTVSATNTVTIAALLGTTIDSTEIEANTIQAGDIATGAVETTEILNGTILFEDLSANSCLNGQIIEYNGSAWVCGTDDDTDTTYSAGTGISIIGTVISSTLGTTVETGEITNGTILFEDLAANSCSSGEVIEFNGTVWICGTDDVNDADADAGNELQDIFTLINAPNGTDPAVDSQTDTLNFADGSGITVTGDATTDTLTIAATLGSAIDTSEITDGTILFADLAQNGCSTNEIIEWNGSAWACDADDVNDADSNATNEIQNLFETFNTPSGTDPVADSATDTLNFAAGSNITITGDSATDTVTIDASFTETDGVIGNEVFNATANGGLVRSGAGTGGDPYTLGLRTDCSSGEIIQFNGSAWVCDTDDVNDADSNATNELQNLFSTIDAPGGTDPVVDSQTDTLTLANGSGVTITGDAGTDTLTFAAVLGTAIDTSEITDGTITFADINANGCSSGEIFEYSGAAWTCGTDDDTTYSAGTGISFAGTVINSTLGTAIDTSEITDGTILFADLAANGCSSGETIEYNGSAWICGTDDTGTTSSFDVTDGTTTETLDNGNTLTFVDGSGVDVVVSATDTVTISSLLGTSIDSSEIEANTIEAGDIATGAVETTEILNGTILFEDLSANSCLNGQIIEYNGSAWVCGTDDDTNTTYSAGTGINIIGTVISSTLGTSVETGEISNGTILFEDLAANSCSSGEVIEFNGSVWICGTDDVNDADSDAGNELQNIFTIINAPNGTDPEVDSQTDTLNFADGSGITITGDSATDTLTIAATLGTAIDTSEITDGTILFADLAQNGCSSGEVVEWNGSAWACDADDVNDADANATNEIQNLFETFSTPSGTSPVADSSTDTLNFAAGTNITITGDSATDTVTIDASFTETDGVIGNEVFDATTNGGLVRSGSGTGGDPYTLGLRTDCSSGEIVQFNGTAWVCDADDVNDADASATNELQNLFSTIDAPGGTDPVVDSQTDTLTFANGSGVTITGDAGTDTLTISAVLGTAIDSSEITDGTITFADINANGCSSGEIFEYSGAAWICGTDDDTTYSAGTGISFAGTVINSTLGTAIDTSEITDGTILFADLAANGCSSGETIEYNGSAWICGTDDTGATYTFDVTDGSTTQTIDNSNTLTFVDGSGIDVTVSATDTVTVAALLGTSIDSTEIEANTILAGDIATGAVESTEILNGTLLFEDLAANGCSNGQVIEYNGSVWICGTDDVNDADSNATNELQNIFTIINAPNGTNPEVDSQTDTLNFADGSGVTITGDSVTDTLTIAATLGTAIDTSEITDGTILFADFAQNGCSSGEVIEWNGSAWACDADDVDDADANATNELQNLFATFDAPSGTDPVADSQTDTIQFIAGANISITGDAATDSLTIASSFTETDGIVGNEVVNATANGGLERSGAGTGGDPYTLGLRTDCADNEVLKWDNGGSSWGCEADQVDDADANPSNELQNVFTVIDTPNGTDPAVDSQTDTLTLTDGTGITITGTAATDTISIAATLGDSIDSSEIALNTIVADDIATGAVETTEILNGTILLEDIGQNGCSSGEIMEWNGSAWACDADDVGSDQNLFETFNTSNGTSPVADSTTDTINFTDGSGITITGDSATDTITIASVLGTDISSAEILNGTILFEDLAANGCSSGEVIEYNGTVWICGTDDVNDADSNATNELQNIFTIINAPNGTNPEVDSQTDTLNFADGSGITITGDSSTDTLTIAATLGTAIDTSEITDGTILFADLAQNACSSGEVIEWNGSAWACDADDVNDADSNATNELQNLFATFDAPSGTDPVADSQTDTIQFVAGANITITGDAAADSLTIASSFTETDGIVGNEVVNATANGGLERSGSGTGGDPYTLGLRTDCSDNEILKWDNGGSAWGCEADQVDDADANATNELQNIFTIIDTPNGTDPAVDSQTDTLTFADGSGITITGAAASDTITIAATLGTAIDSSEITNGTILLEDIGQNGCSSGEVMEWNGSAWACDADDVGSDQNLFETFSTSNGTSPVADSTTDTINFADGSGITVTGDSATDTITIASVLGTDINSAEILNGTVLFEDLAANGCSSGEVVEYNGTVWICGTDDVNDADSNATNELQNIFTIINAPNGTNPEVDSQTDTLNFADGSGITITGDSSTDTLTIAATLGTAIDSSEITDGVILFADLNQNGCSSGEVIEWNGSAWACDADDVDDADANPTNEIQNLFATFDAPSGTDPVADSSTDTIQFVAGANITITGDAAADSLTIASSFTETDGIVGNEVVNATANGGLERAGAGTGGDPFTLGLRTDCADDEILQWDNGGSTWACEPDDVNDADANATNELQNIFQTIDAPNGTDPVVDSQTDTLALLDGSGITITGSAAADSITIAAALGASIDSSEITNGTILLEDIGQNGCNSGEIMEWNGSAWACDADDVGSDQNLFETFATSNGTSPVADSTTDTITFADGSGITVTGDSSTDTITIASVLGTDINSAEILNGTILFEDLAANGCSNGQIIEYNGSVWFCGTDDVNDADANATNELQNIFTIINAPNGTNPEVDSQTDTLNFADGSGITITGDSSTDTLTIAATLGAAIDTSEITDGTILFADLSQNGCSTNEVIEWNGSAWACDADDVNDADSNPSNELQNLFATIDTPSGTDPVADGQTDTLQFLAGSNITITGDSAADSVTIAASFTEVDGVIGNEVLNATTDGGLVRAGAGTGGDPFTLGLRTDCSDNEILKWDNGTTSWGCEADVDTDTDTDTFASVSVDGANQSTSAVILDFDGTDFALTETPADTFDITIQSERIEDIIGAGLSGNTETGVTVTYQDGDGTFDFVVDNLQDLAGTLDVASGGTGLTSLTTNAVLFGNGTGNVGLSNVGTGGQVLLANGSGVPTFTTIGTDLAIDSSGAATIQADAVALGTDTTGNYVATIANGSGISGSSSTEGGTPTISLGPLTSDWDQTGAFDVVLNNAGSELRILESSGDTFFGTLDVGDLNADRTYTLPDADGEVSVLGQTISDAEVDDNITIGAAGSVDWTALTNYPGACAAGTAITALADSPTCTAFNTDTSITLQDAYNEGSLITTSDANDLDIVLNDDATDSNLDIDIEADNFVSISRLDNASAEAPAQLLLLENLDTDLAITDGLTISDAGGGLTNAIDVSDADITNALAVGDNVIQGGTAVIDFTNFDVLGNGNTTVGGTLDTTGTANLNGNVNLGTDATDLLTVNATLQGTNALVFEGSAADGNETTFAITNPTSPQTVTFPDATGEVSLLGQTIANAELVNDSLTITSGNGLTGGGSVALGASVNVDIGAGAGITVNADDVAVDVLTTGTTATTSSNSGLETDASGVRLIGGCANGDVLAWNAAGSVWECSANDGIFTTSTSSNQIIGNTTTLTNVTGMSFNIAANEEWYFEFTLQINADATDDLNVAITCPAGATASFGVESVEQASGEGDIDCGTRSGNIATSNGDEVYRVSGTVLNSTTAGTVQLQLSENTVADAANNITVFAGSSLHALRIPVGTFVAGAGGSFDITDTTNTESVGDGDTITFSAGAGLTVLVSATDTVTYTATLGDSIDASEVDADDLNFTELADSLSLDAITTISTGSSNLIVNLDGTGDFIAQDNGTAFFTLLDSGNILLDGNSADTVELRFGEDSDNGTNYVGFKAPASIVTSLIWTLPNVDGSAGDVLATNGSGLLQWQQGLRTDCADEEILRWDNGGSTWVCDDPVYEKIVIWAEDNGPASATDNTGNEWSFGNGSVGSIGIPLAESWEIYAVTFDAETFGTSVSIDVVNRNGGAVLHSFTANSDNYFETLVTPVSVSAGDTLGFDTTATSGTSTDIRAAVWLRRLP